MPCASSQERALLQSHHEPLGPPHQFAEITSTLMGEERGPTTIVSIPLEEAGEPSEVIGSSIMAMCLIWHPISGEMYIVRWGDVY